MLRGVRNKVVGAIKKDVKRVEGPERKVGAVEDAPRKSGVLVKYTNAFRGWKPRAFTLEMGLLTYVGVHESDEEESSHHGKVTKKLRRIATGGGSGGGGAGGGLRKARSGERERDAKGVIDVQYAVVTPDDSDDTRFAIDTGHDVFHVRAASRGDRDSWVAALVASRRYFSGLVERAASRSTRGLADHANSTDDGGRSPRRKNSESSPTGIRSVAEVGGGSSDADGINEVEGVVEEQAISEEDALGAGDEEVGNDGEELGGEEQGWELEEGGSVRMNGIGREIAGNDGESRMHMPSGYVNSAAWIADMLPDDDGLVEAASSRRALAAELRRVITILVPGEPASLDYLFDDVDAASGLRDLCTWTVHVLQTDTALLDRRVEAGIRGYLGQRDNGGWAFDSDIDGEIDESEYHDAVGRDVSSDFGGVVDGVAAGAGEGGENGESEGGEAKGEDETRALTRVDTLRIATRSELAPRKSLPPLISPPPKLNIWQLLKDAVGKDLSKISLPVGLNEPLGFLQRLAEDIEYAELLDQAAAEPDQHRRLLLVATMVISHYSSTQSRIGKPFNPLQGETFSLVSPSKGMGVRFLAEQLSNHPPMSVCYAEGSDASWKYYNSIEVKNKFWGKSLEVFPTGWNYVEIPGYGDIYEFEQVTAGVHNIFLGTSKMWLDNYGDMAIVNRTTGDRCEIKFQKSGLFSDQNSLGTVSGTVYDANGKAKLKLSGRWTDAVYEDLPRRQRKLLWEVQKRPPLTASNNYNMTQWAISLNAPVPVEDLNSTAPTDSRVRPDLRALENGEFELAGQLKSRLEEAQRARRGAREARGEPYKPRWFDLVKDPDTGREEYKFNNQYFRAQATGNWEGVVDIFRSARDVVGQAQ